MKKSIFVILSMFWLAASACAAPQEHTPIPAAKAEFDKARAMGMGDSKAAVAAYRKAIDLDPDFYSAHQYYILYSGVGVSQTGTDEEKKSAIAKVHRELEEQYKGWAKQHPDKAVYQWALGEICDYENPDQAVRYYQEAIKIDLGYGPAYDMLGISAEEHGDLDLSREYERKAHESWPNDVTLWRHYMGSWVDADFNKAKEIALQMAEKFPVDGTSMLGYLAGRTTDESQARAIYEMLRQKFPKASSGFTLTPLFNMYLKADPNKALALAADMVKNDPSDKTWPVLKDYASAVIDADSLIVHGKAADATATLDKIKLPRFGGDHLVLDLARAKALDASGDTAKAYADLAKVVANTPSDEGRTALVKYGSKLGKDTKQVDADVWAQLDASAKPGIPFSLVNYATGKPVATDQYKGKVFLVNFWYPKCGPCRGEFPYLQQSLEKFKAQGFDILAINGHPPEDEWVMPLIKGWKLGFLPLKGSEEVIKAYKVRGFPSNFLYGPDGRIYPMPAQVRPATMRQFQLQVEALLGKAKEMGQQTTAEIR